MLNLVYVHGFLSSPLSHKAQLTKKWFAQHHPDIHYLCPELSAYPSASYETLHALLSELDANNTFLIGSSLGGFWATHFVEHGLAAKAVLVNPAVNPHKRFVEFIGAPLSSYYGDTQYMLTEQDLCDLETYAIPHCRDMSRYWLLAQTGDATLDYRHGVEHYRGAKQTIEEGGNHSFEGFVHFFPEILKFFMDHKQSNNN